MHISLADLGDIDLVEGLDEKELSKYLDLSQSTTSEARAKNVASPASLRVL